MAVIEGGGAVIEGAGLGAPLRNAGAPTNNVTFLGKAVVGSLLIDTNNGKLYVCTATNGTTTVTWTVVGTQTYGTEGERVGFLRWFGLLGAIAAAAEEAKVLEPSFEASTLYQELARDWMPTRLVRLIRSRGLSLCLVLSKDPR